MIEPMLPNPFGNLIDRIFPHSKLLRTWTLKGGVSAQVTALEIEQHDGQRFKLVVRQHGPADIEQNPRVAADEYMLLKILHATGLAVPAPLYLDQSGEIFTTPCVAIEYIEGTPDFAPADTVDVVHQLATHLSGIHRLDCARHDLSFLPIQEDRIAAKLRDRWAQPDVSLDEGRICDMLEAVWPLPGRNHPVLLHGDYWPGNTLWHAGRLLAVIDWEDAAIGDPLADLGNGRLEILWAFGLDAMHRFTQHYLSLTNIDVADLSYWDLCAALRTAGVLSTWKIDAATEQRMREQHRLFVAQAYENLRSA
jgi:aminoglycoside phosphotransferase (APT) family kinase protein